MDSSPKVSGLIIKKVVMPADCLLTYEMLFCFHKWKYDCFAFCLWNYMMKERVPYQVWIRQYDMMMPRCIVMNAATIHQIHHSWVPQIYIPDAITSHISKIRLSSILQQSMSKKPTYNWGANKEMTTFQTGSYCWRKPCFWSATDIVTSKMYPKK